MVLFESSEGCVTHTGEVPVCANGRKCSSGVVADDGSTILTEGDSVTLNTGVKINQQDVVLWYFNNSRIAAIAGDLSFICTDVQCKNDTERFRNRLKLDHQTGSLTIMNITNTDSGGYMLRISSGSSNTSILVCVSDVPAARRDEMKTKSVVEGEPVTLHPGVTKTPNVVMTWYCNETLIAEITGDQSKICSDVQCKERFRDRLKLDHQTGSLTITNTRTTDSGEYKLQIRSSRFANIRITSLKSFSTSITAPSSPRSTPRPSHPRLGSPRPLDRRGSRHSTNLGHIPVLTAASLSHFLARAQFEAASTSGADRKS
ncbi:uncharacterized protein LOC132159250 [Carassius carassius]|uniref:uncharacterized protein LOC132159250 n=1 Tax=Carassius carassius TaxID=217509 RepID=UPI0028690851|nr:uncharacterized protein LOC132159250 [Carassius carassius]